MKKYIIYSVNDISSIMLFIYFYKKLRQIYSFGQKGKRPKGRGRERTPSRAKELTQKRLPISNNQARL